MPEHTAVQSPAGGAGPLIGVTFADLLGHSLGDLFAVDLRGTAGVCSVGMELALGPAAKAPAGCRVNVDKCGLNSRPAFGAAAAAAAAPLAGSLNKAANVSEITNKKENVSCEGFLFNFRAWTS